MFSRCNAYPHPCSNKTMLSGAKHTPIHCTSNTKINLTFQKFLAVCHLILFRNDSRRSWRSPNLRAHSCLTWMSITHLSGSIFYILFFLTPTPLQFFLPFVLLSTRRHLCSLNSTLHFPWGSNLAEKTSKVVPYEISILKSLQKRFSNILKILLEENSKILHAYILNMCIIIMIF